MPDKYLSYGGLIRFWSKCKTVFAAINHTHSAMSGSSSSVAGKAGFVPAPAVGNQGQYLRGDGTWATPTNTTYDVATTSADGLMSNTDKVKLDGISVGVKTVSLLKTGWSSNRQTVTISGITASSNPIIDVQINSTSVDEIEEVLEEFVKIVHATTATNTMTFYCSEPPAMDLVIIVKGW